MKKGNQQTKKTIRMMTSVLAALMLSLRDSFLQQEVVTFQSGLVARSDLSM